MLRKVLNSKRASAKTENNAIEKPFFEGTNVNCEDETIVKMICNFGCNSTQFEEILEKVGFQMPVTLYLSNDKIMVDMVTEIKLVKPTNLVSGYHKHHILIINANKEENYSVTISKETGVSVSKEGFSEKIAETELNFFYPTSENWMHKYNYSIQRGNIIFEVSLGYKKISEIEHYPELDQKLLAAGKSELEIYKTLLKFYPEISENVVAIATRVKEGRYVTTLSEVQILNGKVIVIEKNADDVYCRVRTDMMYYRYVTEISSVELKDGNLKVEIKDFANNSSSYEDAMKHIENLRKEALNMSV